MSRPSDQRKVAGEIRAAVVVLLPCALFLVGCGEGGSARGPAEWQARVDTIGDTVVVRTLAGSEWGRATLVPELRIGVVEGEEHEMFGDIVGLAVGPEGTLYVYDQQATALRRFGPEGEYLGTLGRRGEGPGEYAQSDGGLLVLSDGRIVLRDPGNGRFTVWGPDGEYLDDWRGPAGRFTSTPMVPARDGGFYNPVFGGGRPTRMVWHGPDGTPKDTLPPPDSDVDPPRLVAQGEGISYTFQVPFTTRTVWAFHPDGFYVSAVTDRLAVDFRRPRGPVLRFEKEVSPAPVTPRERAAEEDRIRRRMQQADPEWRWQGPPIPETKPVIRDLFVGDDGWIWVQLHRPGEPDPHQDLAPGPDGERPVPRFREPVVFDVFESDGRYLGRVETPSGLTLQPRPVFRGEAVWGVEEDELGVEYVVRYRVQAENGG